MNKHIAYDQANITDLVKQTVIPVQVSKDEIAYLRNVVGKRLKVLCSDDSKTETFNSDAINAVSGFYRYLDDKYKFPDEMRSNEWIDYNIEDELTETLYSELVTIRKSIEEANNGIAYPDGLQDEGDKNHLGVVIKRLAYACKIGTVPEKV